MSNSYRVERPLAKDLVHKKVSGVCGGIARHFELPRLLVRAVVVIAGLMMPMVTVVAYIVAALLMPNRH
ncbi:PspC domain-containing protein [Thalassomonas sp. M1454]|uniref:PspC domain-containing protein n=1 Tax=Thalassomonas sp. M1454 TaxID=2594477 RepID=UPI00117DB547|nr:PspC domain-containing protein [Thalassomonas sp. M1454]TRX53478.1 PspC domain-containing protein [Thalassomonas sp. M1454]